MTADTALDLIAAVTFYALVLVAIGVVAWPLTRDSKLWDVVEGREG